MVKTHKTTPLNQDGSVNIENWLQQIHNTSPLVKSACSLSQVAGEDRANHYARSCFLQSLEIAEHIARLKLGDEAIAAALVYPAYEYAGLSLEDIEEQLGSRVTKLVHSTHKLHDISSIQSLSSTSLKQIDNIRKMLLSMVQDVSVVIIKLAERLSIMRTCNHLSDIEKKRLANETMEVYAPLASRLGTNIIKWQLEDLSFAILDPDNYFTIAKNLRERRIDREERVQSLINHLNKFLEKTGIAGEIQGRAKHIYSIYRKMQRKKVGLEQIYDAIALRILVPTIEDCYTLLSYVHDTWKPIKEEFDDYIAKPKLNGYRSIHTAALDTDGKPFEIQIRTFNMHEESEMGVAAHWMYKEGSAATGYEEKIKWLRQLLEWQKEVSDNKELPIELEKNVFEERIYVFTPNGEIIDMQPGSTPLDFAYHIHTDLGHRCRGAKIKGKLVPLTTALQLGDVVEILTAKTGAPSRDWLISQRGYLKTARARAKVHHWFKKQDLERHIEEGRNLLEKEIKRLNLEDPNLEKLALQLNYKDQDNMFAALGNGDLRFAQVIGALQKNLEIKSTSTQIFHATSKKPPSKKYHGDIAIYGVGDLLTHIANCCKPIPGDPIVGYITQGHGVSIHHRDCKNIINLDDHYNNKLIEVEWIETTQASYPVDIEIQAFDRAGLISDIAQILANDKINILNLNTVTNKKQHTAYITVTIEINDLADLSHILDKINQIPNINSVIRKRTYEKPH
ncbi:MAG: hypothetical protein A3E87_04385 [Gammaproteobacteria bacterium RIFCSPHIGHO2_12_FULL_35_23]|nr:MAG: hypothetical protein A3E87_04385 [Gammaproteobacteria bacterium RIFCSPHIGHO2_12_FULL_35_23]